MQEATALPRQVEEKPDDDGELFAGGPPYKLQQMLRLVQPGEKRIARRAAVVAIAGWAVLALLVVLDELQGHAGVARAFFNDFAAYARFLIAAPALVLAERDCIPRLSSIARHFVEAGFIIDEERARYFQIRRSTRRVLESRLGEVITVVLAYVTIGLLIQFVPADQFPVWVQSGAGRSPDMSPAGLWQALVSMPLLLVLFYGWLWRVMLWARFLLLVSRLRLRLVPGHPDKTAGLFFVSASLRGFRLLAFAMGTIAAGTVANRVARDGASPLEFKPVAIVIAVVVIVLFAGPLVLFVSKLREAKKRGTFLYGALASSVGRQFEQKWLDRTDEIDQEALAQPDFSATTDLFGVVANVYEMRDVPFSLRTLILLVASALLPFLPVALLVVPLKVVLQEVAKFLL